MLEGVVRFGTEDGFFGDPFYDVVVEGEPVAVEFGVVYVVTFMDICADVGDDCEEVVCAVSVVELMGDGVRSVGSHVQCYWESNVFIDFCLSTVKALATLVTFSKVCTFSCRHNTLGRTFIDICFVAPVEVEQFEQVY